LFGSFLPSSNYAADEESRLREIIEPLYAIAPQEYRQAFDEVLTREGAVRLERLQDTRECRVLDALNNVVKNFGTEAAFKYLKTNFSPQSGDSRLRILESELAATRERLSWKQSTQNN
jgi:hypothetical protein